MSRTVRQWLQSMMQRATPSQAAPVSLAVETAEFVSLGQDASGVTHVLNLRTGRIESAAPEAQAGSPFIAFDQFDRKRVVEILVQGGYRAWVDGDVVVSTELGLVVVEIKCAAELLCLSCAFAFEPEVPPADRDALVDSLNTMAFIVRFHTGSDGANLYAEYEMPIAIGMSAAQLLAGVRAHSFHASRALSRCDAGEFLQ